MAVNVSRSPAIEAVICVLGARLICHFAEVFAAPVAKVSRSFAHDWNVTPGIVMRGGISVFPTFLWSDSGVVLRCLR